MIIDPNTVSSTLKFEQFIRDGGWCSSPFFCVSNLLIQILTARGVTFAFNRIGPVVSLNGQRLFLMTSGYTPPDHFDIPPLEDISTHYLHAVNMDRTPFFQVHCTEQEKLVEFMFDQFKELFEAAPLTDTEKGQLAQVLANSKV